jgi:hypothetical protein
LQREPVVPDGQVRQLCWLLGSSVRKVDGFAFHLCGFTKLWHTPMKGGFVPDCVFLFK